MIQLVSFKNKYSTLIRINTIINGLDHNENIIYSALSAPNHQNNIIYFNGRDIPNLDDYMAQGDNGMGYYIRTNPANINVANERMILNIATQSTALTLCNYISNHAFDKIEGIKLYASTGAIISQPGKCDTIVVYYDQKNRNPIFEHIKAFAEENRINGDLTINDLSAFYDIYCDSLVPGIYVGIAPERDPEVSYTMENTQFILNYLQNHQGVHIEPEDIFNAWCKDRGYNVII